jgi:structural maintenance of chromosome 1
VFGSGVVFSLMPPFKRYTNIELLSGGEKTVAAVALLFSFLSFSAPPFSMVDEIDAALDADNVNVLSRFMKHAVPHQLLVISLKENLYAKADCLVGVYKDAHTQGSGLVTVDLRPYSDEDMSTQGEDEAALRTVMKTDKKGLDGPQMTPAPVSSIREGRVLMGGA